MRIGLFTDGLQHLSRRDAFVWCVEHGITDVEITTYGPVRRLHSGHYGNYAPNLDELLALSSDQPLLLFKHSETCGTSFEARYAAIAFPLFALAIAYGVR